MDPVTLGLFGLYAAVLLLETVRPARRDFPRVRLWRLAGLASFALYWFVGGWVPLLTDAWFAEHRLVDATGLGTLAGAAVGFLVIELGTWLWHRALHRSGTLFRVFHQMHHSQERHDAFGTFWFSPLDMVAFTLLGSVCLVLVVGISGEAALLVNVAVFALNVFQHANLRTPRWLGYLVVRPESHSVHHERGVHAWNYCDLPVIDMLFGTFRNPADFVPQVGYWDGASRKVGAMLLGRDVSAPVVAAPAVARDEVVTAGHGSRRDNGHGTVAVEGTVAA